MKINNSQINSFVKNIPNTIRAVLLYGVDYGLIKDLAINFKQSFLGNNFSTDAIVELDANELKKNQALLQEALYSENLFVQNSKKIIIIANCNTTTSTIVSNILDSINQDTLLLLLAGELPSSNSLRKLAETKNTIAAITCYHDNSESLKSYIKNTLIASSYTIDAEALTWLSNNLGNDRLITKQEINKLMLYKTNNTHITLKDVLEVVSNNYELALNEIVFDITLGNQAKVYSELQLFLLNFPAIIVVRALDNSFRRLLLAKQLQSENLNIGIIATKLRPPILFLYLNNFKRQMALWDSNNIYTYIKKLVELELAIKVNPNLAFTLLNKFTLEIALNITNTIV